MKNVNLVKSGALLLFGCLLVAETEAQNRQGGSRPARTRQQTSGYGQSGYGNTNTNTNNNNTKPTTNNQQSGYGTTNPNNSSGYGSTGYGSQSQTSGGQEIKANVPIETVKSSSSGIGDSVAPALRTDNAIDRQLVKDRTPLAYEHIREDDAVYKQRVWREIDTREKMNLPFRYAANEDNGNQRFISILYNSIMSGDVTVFSGDDDRFTTPLTREQVAQMVTGGMDTVPEYNMEGEIVKYKVMQRMMEPDSIYRFRIKEEWIFDKESSRMHVRILGIAPIMTKYTTSGIPIGDMTLFWAYYPDLRPTLAKYEVYNGKNYAGRMSWEELFESRFFSSYITKSTIDNPFDQSLKQSIKDPLFRLLEGENIREKIFNYEQDLWSY